ncbi:hypothetical protein MASR1M8_00730 [Thermomonas brevis]
MVHREPYCLWGHDIKERNVEFLKGLDTDYFDFLTTLGLEAEDSKRASVMLSTTLHHATETLFSLVGAYVQAPDCVYAWIAKCQNSQLRNFVKDIASGDESIVRKLNLQSLSWEEISRSVCVYLPYEDEKKAAIANGFARAWRRLAGEFTDEFQIDQYNSLKHGLRLMPGGFKLAVGTEPAPGVKPSVFHDLGGSDYGMTYQKIRNIWPDKKSKSIKYTRTSVNWSINKVVGQLQLVSCSICNVVSALKAVNGVPLTECKFLSPEPHDEFDKPWTHSVGVNNFNMDFTVDTSNTAPVTAEQVIETFKQK